MVKQTAGNFWTVVDPDTSRLVSEPGKPIEFVDNLIGPEVRSHNGRESFSRIAVDDRQDPERPIVEQLVRHEVHGPAVVPMDLLWAPISARPDRWRHARRRLGLHVRIDRPSSR